MLPLLGQQDLYVINPSGKTLLCFFIEKKPTENKSDKN